MYKSKKLIQFATFLILVFGFVQISDAQSRGDRALIRQAERVSGDSFGMTTTTPKGAKIYAVNNPSKSMLNAIDQGLADLFAVAKKNNYSRRLNYSDYTIFIAKPDRTKDADGNYSPAFAIGAAQYAGSVYDKGGYIYVAGMVLSNDPMAFIFVDRDRDLQGVSDVVRYEGEHLVLFQNDRQRYYETADHSKGGGHPILQ